MTFDPFSHVWADEQLDWENAYTASAQEFFTDFHLHDSHWVGIQSEPERRELICVVVFDCVWNPSIVTKDHSGAPYLFLCFPHCFQLTFSDDKNHSDPVWPYVIVDAYSEPLSEVTYGPLQKVVRTGNDPLYHTVFEGIDDETVHIVHSGSIQARCYNRDGSEIPIKKPKRDV